MEWFWVLAGIVLLFGFVVFRGAPYVPSHKKEVQRAFNDLYALNKNDVLVDVGSGDGIILREASGRGARAVGYELNPALVLISKVLSRGNRKVSVRLADFWLTPLPSDTTVVYAFTVMRDIKKMEAKLQNEASRLNRPLYLISYGSNIPDREPAKVVQAHYLYRFEPLQATKAQV